MERTIILSLKLQHGIFSLKYFAQYLIPRLIKYRPTLLQKVVEPVTGCTTTRNYLQAGTNRVCIGQGEETVQSPNLLPDLQVFSDYLNDLKNLWPSHQTHTIKKKNTVFYWIK